MAHQKLNLEELKNLLQDHYEMGKNRSHPRSVIQRDLAEYARHFADSFAKGDDEQILHALKNLLYYGASLAGGAK